MRKFLKYVLIFAIVCIIAYPLFLLAWGRFAPQAFMPNLNYKIGTYGHMFSRLNEAKKTKNVDVLFLGSSHTYRGFDTRIFKAAGINSFNLGSSSQSPLQTKVLLKRYLEKLNPKLIVYEVFPSTFVSDGVESSLDIIANEKNDLNTLAMTLKINHLKVYNTFLFGCMMDLFNFNSGFVEPKVSGDDTYISGGFVERKIKYYKPEKYPKKEIILNQKQLDAFDETVKMIKKKNIELVLVFAPVTSSTYNCYTNINEFENIMKGYGKFYNFNNKLPLNDSLNFYDGHHLNQTGVEIFDSSLIQKLKEDFKMQ